MIGCGMHRHQLRRNDDAEIVETCVGAFGEMHGGESGADRSHSPHANDGDIPDDFARKSDFLTHPVFTSYHSETEMLRYMRRLADRDLALDRSMIPLGSCTMKLNATAEMMPLTWPDSRDLHPFAPAEQAQGYAADDRRPRGEAVRDHRAMTRFRCSRIPARRANTPDCWPSAPIIAAAARAIAPSA